ncbi:MAG TPA: S8 family serine peptidase, partial [Vicinamibacterales bacterium]|nr:S8 family serine peptidase [Vicinamibacterales bacterium]
PSGSNPTPGASSNDVAAAIDWARLHGANVINMSLGAPGGSDPLEHTAIQNAINANIVVVAAAGNDGLAELLYPASDPLVISVGADALNDSAAPGDPTKATEYVASYSDYGNVSTPMDLIAPGGDPSGSSDNDFLHWILNLWSNTANTIPGPDILIAGTSKAAPHVAGAAALILSKNATLTPAQVRTIIDNTADNIGDAKQGHGRLNVDQALFITP